MASESRQRESYSSTSSALYEEGRPRISAIRGHAKDMLIKTIPDLRQHRLPEPRLVERPMFNGLTPSLLTRHPASTETL